jgi:hypothetical protein
MALVRKRTIPTERPPLVGEVSANFSWIECVAWSAQRIPAAHIIGFLDQSRYYFSRVAPQSALVNVPSKGLSVVSLKIEL